MKVWVRLPSIERILGADGKVARLLKSLYGLREAPRLWFQALEKAQRSLGFRKLLSSEFLFIMTNDHGIVLLLAYVDDLKLFGKESIIQLVTDELSKIFKLTDMGVSEFFLGIRIVEDSSGITLSQRATVDKVLRMANMDDCKPLKTSLPIGHCLYERRDLVTNDEEARNMEFIPYQEVLGGVLYLATRTRPDISTVVSMLDKFASAPRQQHWNAMKYLLRYLQGTGDYGCSYAEEVFVVQGLKLGQMLIGVAT